VAWAYGSKGLLQALAFNWIPISSGGLIVLTPRIRANLVQACDSQSPCNSTTQMGISFRHQRERLFDMAQPTANIAFRRSSHNRHANVLGVSVNAINITEAADECERLIASRRRGQVCVTGVHGVMEAQSDPQFRAILNSSFLTVPDGTPLVWVGRLQGHHQMAEFMDRIS